MRDQSLLRLLLVFIVGVAFAACDSPVEGPADGSVEATPDLSVPTSPINPVPHATNLNPNRVALGKALFNDVRLSVNNAIACVSCHDLGNGGDDGRSRSVGVDGKPTAYNAPSVLNSSLNFAQFWDGRVASLSEQIVATLENPTEMGADLGAVVVELTNDSGLVSGFARAYKDGLTQDNLVDAIETYVRALVTPNSPFDRYLMGDAGALSPEAQKGYGRFLELGCVSCHQGRGIGGNLFQNFGVMGDYFSDRGSSSRSDYGRYNVTGREQDKFKFKVPSLRNVAETAPYLHDGSLENLEDVVAVMIEYQLGRVDDSEDIESLVAFLESLSGELDPALL